MYKSNVTSTEVTSVASFLWCRNFASVEIPDVTSLTTRRSTPCSCDECAFLVFVANTADLFPGEPHLPELLPDIRVPWLLRQRLQVRMWRKSTSPHTIEMRPGRHSRLSFVVGIPLLWRLYSVSFCSSQGRRSTKSDKNKSRFSPIWHRIFLVS